MSQGSTGPLNLKTDEGKAEETECIGPHCKLDPPKGDAIAKAVKHPIKKAEYQRSERETKNSPDPKVDLIAADQTFNPIEDSTSLDPAGVTPSPRL